MLPFSCVLTFLVELPDDRLDKVVVRDDVSSLGHPDHDVRSEENDALHNGDEDLGHFNLKSSMNTGSHKQTAGQCIDADCLTQIVSLRI